MKKIALVADVKDWAFHIAAKVIQGALSDRYKIDIYWADCEEFKKDLFTILEALKDYDMIHFFWRGILKAFEEKEFNDDFRAKVIEKYGDYDEYVKNAVRKISTGIYDHLYEEDMQRNVNLIKYSHKYVVSSKELFDIYSNLDGVAKPAAVLGDSFSKERFYPINMERFNFKNTPDEQLIIGWVGNSTWNKAQKDENGNSIDFKGFHTILKPVIDELQAEGYNIVLNCADRNVKQIPNEEMGKYFSQIHIYICVSNKEGTPRPLIEAMGCGIPVITTDVGVASEALGNKQKEYILGKRIIGQNDEEIRKKLKEKILYLYNNKGILKELSDENYKASKYYEIECMKEKYAKYYDDFINS